MRQLLCFTAVVATAYATRNAVLTVAVLAAANLIPAIVFAPRARVAGTALQQSQRRAAEDNSSSTPSRSCSRSSSISSSGSINRHVALAHLGAEATGKFSLATDLGQRLFGAANSLPELMLFQYVLKIDRTEGRAAAERQQSRNISLSLGFLAPLAVGYAVDGADLRGADGAGRLSRPVRRALSAELAPGYFALFAIISAISPIFQLQGLDLAIERSPRCSRSSSISRWSSSPRSSASIDGLAIAYSVSLGDRAAGDDGLSPSASRRCGRGRAI